MQTEYHPAGTCAMMPLELGGVVSPELLLYRTSNLRIVDSSIILVLPGAHLQAVVYGIAEKVRGCILHTGSDTDMQPAGRGHHQGSECSSDPRRVLVPAIVDARHCVLVRPASDVVRHSDIITPYYIGRTTSGRHYICYSVRHSDDICLRNSVSLRI